MATENNRPIFDGMTFESFFRDEVIENPEPPEKKEEPADDPLTEDPKSIIPDDPADDPVDPSEDPGEQGAEPEELSLFEQLNSEFGIELEDEFQEDFDGIKGYVQKVGSELAARQLDGLFQKFPVAAEFMDYLVSGGDPSKFFESAGTDYSTIEITDDNESVQERVIAMKLRDDGFDEDEVKQKLENYKSAALLKTEAESALRVMKKRDEQRKTEKQADMEKQRQEEERQYNEFVQSTSETIRKGKLVNVQIPEKEKAQFFDFIYKPVSKDGRTQRDVMREKLTLEQRLELEYLMYKGLKLDSLVMARKETVNVSHLRKNAEKETQKNQRKGSSAANVKTTVLPEGYSLRDLGL